MLKATDGSLNELSLDSNKNITYDSSIILTDTNFSNYITGITGMTGGSSWVGTATSDLNMGTHDITNLSEIDMVGADNSTLALSIDPITKLIRYTTGEWLVGGNDNYGIIYDTKFNQPLGAFPTTNKSALDMNDYPVENVSEVSLRAVVQGTNFSLF